MRPRERRFGLGCALVTPFAANGAVDLPRFVLHARRCLAEGCSSITLGGTTGEGASIGFGERAAMLDALRAGGVDLSRHVLAGIAVGAAIHGYVPENFMAGIMGARAWWSVPLAVLIGIPMYSNAAGILPIVQALLEKGAALGTVLAFMMSVIAISFPEMIILRKVLKVRLIATFAGVVGTGILLVGYLFNLVV